MTIIKIIFSAIGDKFYPNNILSKLKNTSLNGEILFNPDNIKKHSIKNEKYDYGVMSFMHPKIFGDDLEYEESFIKFFEDNYKVFKKYGATEFTFFIEVYYSDEQCNFEVFNKSILKRICKYGVSIPISVYLLSEDEINKLLQNDELN